MTVNDKITPYRNEGIKGNIQKWFDSKVLEKLNARDVRLNIDKELYKKLTMMPQN